MRVAILTTDNREDSKNYLATQPYFGTAPTALLEGFAGMQELEIHVVSCLHQPVTAPEKLASNIWYHALTVSQWGWLRTGYLGCIRAVRRKLAEIQPDLVHGQGTERDCAMNAVWSGYPNVLTIHGNMAALAQKFSAPLGSFGWFAARLENHALGRTSGVLCNSHHTEQLVARRTPRAWLVPNPVREMFFTALPVRAQNSKPVLLNVGTVCANKQQLEILAVAHDLHRRGLVFELRFVGALPAGETYSAEFQRQLAEAERAGYARYLGWLNGTELLAAMDGADALLHFPQEEAFGLVVAEALARNLKIFAARVGGLVDIAHGAAGADLFAAGDWIAFTDALGAWLRAGGGATDNAELMRGRFHPQAIAQRHSEIYTEVLKARV